MSVELKNISFSVKDKDILSDVSLKINDGEFTSLLGASGAGKSTTIKIIAGILGQTSGSVLIDNEVVDNVPANKRHVSIAFQDMRLFPHMTVGENVAFPMKMKRVSKKERIEKADYYLELVQLPGFASRRVDELSGGQQQRVALARAVAAAPRVLLLDEPFSGLDENLRDDMRFMVRDLHNKLGITTAMITHDAIEALTMSDHIIYMKDGRVVQDSTPTELYESPASADVALCFGNAISLKGNVLNGVFDDGFVKLSCNVADGAAVAVVRDEGIDVVADNSAPLVVKSCLYSGEGYQLVLSLNENVLSVTSKESFVPGSHVAIKIQPGFEFVYTE